MLRNTATRLCLYETAGRLYRTTVCDRNAHSAVDRRLSGAVA